MLPFPTKYFPESEVTELGAYVQAEMSLAGGRVKLAPGLRYDRFDLDADERAFPSRSSTTTMMALSRRWRSASTRRA